MNSLLIGEKVPVIVTSNSEQTIEKYGYNIDMRRLEGQEITAEKITEEEYEINGWSFHVSQLELLEEEETNPRLTKEDLISELTLVYLKKNKDYGNSVAITRERFGDVATLVRISDKVNRLKTLRTRGAEVQESVEDTIMDMINYWGIYKSFKLEGNILMNFIETITEFIYTPRATLDTIQNVLGTTILDNNTSDYILLVLEELLD